MLSRRFQAIFVHIPKTAGQSIEHLFLRAHGLDWKRREALLLRPNDNPAKGPERLAHLFAREYVELGHVARDEFARCYRFAVVRDPYDRLISEFNFRRHEHATLRDFVAAVPDEPFTDRWRHVAPQIDYLFDAAGALLVDDVLRFERLDEEIAKVVARIPQLDGPLEHVNPPRALRLRRADLSAADIAFVNARYADDFRILGYPVM